MRKIIANLSNIDYFDICTAGGISFGGDQAWYETEWQRKSGCGPTAAANLFYYLSKTKPENFERLCPHPAPPTRERLFQLMESVWPFVTPTPMGVNSTQLFAGGAEKYALEKKVPLRCHTFDVPHVISRAGVSFDAFIAFIKTGLSSGCPVAFLNLSNGQLENLYHWHWVTLLSLETDENGGFFSLASDEGEKKVFDMKLWFETTILGGGVVYCETE